jgi:spermidine/putrescine transport system ATP-binding protein
MLQGRDILGDPPNRRPVNIVFQSYALFPHMSVAENIAFGLERLGRGASEVKARVDEMLGLVRLEAFGGRRPHQLSGGQQQRVALARALAPAPKLLLLDEPMSALDVKLRHDMQGELKRMQRETGITFLLVTHDQDEALSMSGRIAVMNAGRVVQMGTPADIYERPASRFVADFMGSNVLPGAALGLTSRYAAIRPARVEVRPAGDGAGTPGVVLETTYLGERTACVIKIDAGAEVKAEWSTARGRLAPGQRVFCHFPGDALVALEN